MIRPTYVLLSALALPAIAAGVNPISKALEASGTSRERISKQAALTGITRGVLLPGYAELTASCAALAKVADELHASPSVTSLKKTQEAWVTALLAWRRTQSFVRGPVTDLNVYGRLQFWPLRPDSVDRSCATSARLTRPTSRRSAQTPSVYSLSRSSCSTPLTMRPCSPSSRARRDNGAGLRARTGPRTGKESPARGRRVEGTGGLRRDVQIRRWRLTGGVRTWTAEVSHRQPRSFLHRHANERPS